MSRSPAGVPGAYSPAPKKMSWPTVKARASRRAQSSAASASACTFTADRSRSKRCSIAPRTVSASASPVLR